MSEIIEEASKNVREMPAPQSSNLDDDFSPSREAIESSIEGEIAALKAQLDDVQADQHAADPPLAAAAQGGGTPDGNAGTEDGDGESHWVQHDAL